MSTRITLQPRIARKVPDPFSNSAHGTNRHVFFVPVADLPPGISMDPAPRSPMTRWDIYKEVQASLLNQDCTPGTFHLKNRGITIVADSVEKLEENEFLVELKDGQGIIDGAHTYRAIIEARQNKSVTLPPRQYVKVEVITSVPREWLGEISGGLNTSIQGQQDSMRHLEDAVQWIKDELGDRRYFSSIAWSEQQRGDIDIRDLLCIMTLFNTSSYPNSGTHHPIVAYDNKSVVMSTFEQDFKNADGDAYKRMRPILRDILSLHDIIRMEFPKFHRQTGADARGLIETSRDRPFIFPFLQRQGGERLTKGALYPALAAFRWLIEDDPSADAVRWKGGLEAVLRRWRDLAPKFAQQSADRIREADGNADALGRSASHWGMLHKEVALAELMTPSAGPAPAAADAGHLPGTGASRPARQLDGAEVETVLQQAQPPHGTTADGHDESDPTEAELEAIPAPALKR